MKQVIADILSFFRDDFFPNLGYYLLQIFLIVLVVLVFSGINIAVRLVTDPICIKVLRMKEEKRWPGLVGLFVTAIITAYLLMFSYTHFPQLRPTVVGWLGKELRAVATWDKLPDLEMPDSIPGLDKSGVGDVLPPIPTATTPAPIQKPAPDEATATPAPAG